MPEALRIDPSQVASVAAELYVRALKILPPDIKSGLDRLGKTETSPTARAILATLEKNVAVAEAGAKLLCQDTGIPIYNITIGRHLEVDGHALKEAIREGCTRATREHPLRSSVVHPLSRINEHTSCGRRVPVIHIDFSDREGELEIEMIPKGSGSENQSWLKMALPADGIDAIKTFVIDCVLAAGAKPCPPTIVGVGIGGTADSCMHLAKIAATRALYTRCDDPLGSALEETLTRAINRLGIGPQGLGGESTAFAVHVETAATHITLNPVAVNLQCHSARRARALITRNGIHYGH